VGEKHLTLKLAITELGPGQYRSRIEQSPAGASSGPGSDFALPEEQIKDWIQPVANGIVSRENLEEIGQTLFKLALRDEVKFRYGQCVALARNDDARLRIVLSILSPRLIAVPWEYMHDGQSFLLKERQSIVRVIDERPEGRAYLGPVKRLLVAVANPNDQPRFNAEQHLERLKDALGPSCRPDVLMPANADKIRQALLNNGYDAFYFVGHGRFTEKLKGQLILEGTSGLSEYLDAENLAQWTKEGSIRFAYLNACSGARTGRGNPFTGVSQRLMLAGGVDCVVAMQAPIAQGAALKISEAFFADLQNGYSPEVALARSRSAPDDFMTWGLPVLYTYIRGVETEAALEAEPKRPAPPEPGEGGEGHKVSVTIPSSPESAVKQAIAHAKFVHAKFVAAGLLDLDTSVDPFGREKSWEGPDRLFEVSTFLWLPKVPQIEVATKFPFTPSAAICVADPGRTMDGLCRHLTPERLKFFVSQRPDKLHDNEKNLLIRAMSSILKDSLVVAVAVPSPLLDLGKSEPMLAYQILVDLFLLPLVGIHKQFEVNELNLHLGKVDTTNPVRGRTQRDSVDAALYKLIKKMVQPGGPRKMKTTLELVKESDPTYPILYLARFFTWAVHALYNSNNSHWIDEIKKAFESG
jgi:hypothetical protein